MVAPIRIPDEVYQDFLVASGLSPDGAVPERVVFNAPPGHPDVQPVECMRLRNELFVLLELDHSDMRKIKRNGQKLWLIFEGSMPPWTIVPFEL